MEVGVVENKTSGDLQESRCAFGKCCTTKPIEGDVIRSSSESRLVGDHRTRVYQEENGSEEGRFYLVAQ